MKLREVTRSLIAALERKSGYPVQVLEEPNLNTLATIRIARGDVLAHILKYKSGVKNETPDFEICFECAMALRMYECPPEERFLIGSVPESDLAVDELLKAPGGVAEKYNLDEGRVAAFGNQLLNGLMLHLRSVPIGLRVSESLTVKYPELLEGEAQHVEKELDLARQSLAPSVREVIPPEVYRPTQSISAAYTLFWAGRLQRPEIVNPFYVEHYDRPGQALLDIYAAVPGDPRHDYELIDRWAEALQIRDWYRWVPYQAP